MTREEAIKGLKVLRNDFSGYKPNEEMFDMAIEALEAQLPMIKREDYMTEKEIADLLYDELGYAYCDNCRGSDLESADDIEKQCEGCHRKSQNWGIRRATADRLASMIVKRRNI